MKNVLDIKNYLSNAIEETAPDFVEFFNAFLEYVESKMYDPAVRIDIDQLSMDFIENLKYEYAHDIPLVTQIKNLTLDEIKNLFKTTIMLNKTKGTVDSIMYLFRALFARDIEIEFGRFGNYTEAKPYAFKVVEVDDFNNPLPVGLFDAYSNQPFYVSGDQTRTGMVITYFKDYNDNGSNNIWLVTDHRIEDGEVLFFYNTGGRLLVTDTNLLQLDGWKDELIRWKDNKGFYVLSEINPRIDTLFYKEIGGYQYIDIDDVVYEHPTGAYTLRFIAGMLSIVRNPAVSVPDEFDQTVYVIGFKNDIEYSLKLDFSVYQDRIDDLLVNNEVIDCDELLAGRPVPVKATCFLDEFGNPPVTEQILEDIRNRIAAFTIIFKTNVPPTMYLELLRMTVIPAGYRLVHLFFMVSAALDMVSARVVDGSPITPNYTIVWYRKNELYSVYNPYEFDYTKYWGRTSGGFYNLHDLSEYSMINFVDQDKYINERMYEQVMPKARVTKILPKSESFINFESFTVESELTQF